MNTPTKEELDEAIKYFTKCYEQAPMNVDRIALYILTKYRDGEQKEQWISVKDRLPEHGDEYNVLWEFEKGNPVVTTMEYNAITKEWIDVSGFNNDCTDQVTHWQPLPSPPTNQTEKT